MAGVPTPLVESSRYRQQEELDRQMEGHEQAAPAPAPGPRAPEGRPYAPRGGFRSRRGTPAAGSAHHPARRDGQHAQDADPTQGAAGVAPFPAPLPGSHHYLAKDAVLPHQPLDVGPADPYYSKGMAHGVPADVRHGGRITPRPEDRAELAASRPLIEEETRPAVEPVPVYIVETGTGARPLLRAALRNVPVPAAGADPVVIVPRNPARKSVRLLNESSSPVRITFDLTENGGALLPASMTSYLEIDTEDEICAYQPAGGTPALISVIDQYGVAGGT